MPFPDLAHSLRAENWKNNRTLAEQVYAVFMTYHQGMTGPLRINVPDVTDPMTGEKQSDGFPFEFIMPDGTKKQMGTDGQVKNVTADPITGEEQKKTPVSATVAIGRIASGEGRNYQVDLYENGLAQSATGRVAAEQQNLTDTSDKLPVGRTVAVYRAGDFFYLLEPVWLTS